MGFIANQVVRMSAGEMGCSYAAMILNDDGLEITEDNINKLLKAANVQCDTFWPGLFAKTLGSQDVSKLICTPATGGGGGGGGGGGAGGAGGDAGGAAEEAKKESSEEEEMFLL